jgi:hypothetical protein
MQLALRCGRVRFRAPWESDEHCRKVGAMSKGAAREFLDHVTRHDAVRERIRVDLEGAEDRVAASVALAAQLGFVLTCDEFLQALQERYGGAELGDEELDQVAGGVFPAATQGDGLVVAFPDACRTPASPAPFVPVPYPNLGDASTPAKPVKKPSR